MTGGRRPTRLELELERFPAHHACRRCGLLLPEPGPHFAIGRVQCLADDFDDPEQRRRAAVRERREIERRAAEPPVDLAWRPSSCCCGPRQRDHRLGATTCGRCHLPIRGALPSAGR